MSPVRVAIVGGGVSGLATAYFLGRLGIRSLLIEKSDRLGGLIKTDYLEGCRLEAGPDSYIANKPAVTELAGELAELSDQVIGSNDALRRVFIVREGKLLPLPQGMTMMVPGKWSPALKSELFHSGTKLRFLRETLARPRRRAQDISVGELVSDHFGKEVLEYVADPLLAGVYGGSAASLSAQSVLPRFLEYEEQFGSLIKGVRKEASARPKGGLFLSFRDGMQSLTDSLSAVIRDSGEVLHGEVTALSRTQNSWRLQVGNETVEADAVVLACPAYVCGKLLADIASPLACELNEIQYSSAILVTLVYEAARLKQTLDGFGFLVPQRERRTVAAATWVNNKFPSRIKAGLLAARAFIVAEQAVRLMNESREHITGLVGADFQRLVGIDAQPQFSTLYRWPDSMPQYTVGHKARVKRINEYTANLPFLYLTGNAYDGVGIPDCIRLAKVVTQKISEN